MLLYLVGYLASSNHVCPSTVILFQFVVQRRVQPPIPLYPTHPIPNETKTFDSQVIEQVQLTIAKITIIPAYL